MMKTTIPTLRSNAAYTLKTSVVLPSVFLACAVLSGCAASSDKYPSLAQRDFEKAPTAAPTPNSAPNTIAPIPAVMGSQSIRQLLAQRDSARGAHAAFMAALPAARRQSSAARGAGPSANIWAEAQLAIAELTVYRSRSAAALANIDEIIAQASIAQRVLPPQTQYQTEVADMIARQDRAIAALSSAL